MIIYKYQIQLSEILILQLPVRSMIRHVGHQNEVITFWIEQDDHESKTEERVFRIIGTGERYPTNLRHVGTVQVGVYVWHLMELER